MRSVKLIVTFLIVWGGIAFSVSANSVTNLLNRRSLKPEVKAQIDHLADSCWSIREEDPEAAIAIGKIGLNLASAAGTSHRVNELHNYIGAIYLNYLHDINHAVPYFEKAYNLCLASGDSVQLGYAYNNLGDLYYTTNNLRLAIKYDTLSYNLFHQVNFRRGMAYSLTNLGEVYLAKEAYEKAIIYFQQLNELETELNNLSGIAFSLLKLGLTYIEIGAYDQSLNYLEQSYDLTKKFNNKTFKAKCLTGLAKINTIQQNYSKANELLNEALELNNEANYTPEIILNRLDLALLKSKTAQAKEGEEHLKAAEQLANQLGFPSYIVNVKKSKVDFYTHLNDSVSIIRAYQQYFSVFDSLYTAQNLETLQEMQKSLQARFSIDKMKGDLEAKQKEKTYLSIIIALLLVLGLLFFWRFRTIASLNRRLIESNTTKDKLFSIIAHDLKSPFNSLIGMSELLNNSLSNKDYPAMEKYCPVIEKTAKETYGLINNLLNWSRSQLAEIKLHPEPIKVKTFIDQIVDLYAPVAEAKHIKIRNEVNEQIIEMDKNSIQIVISNLLSNALKFTPPGGHVVFFASKQNGHFSLHIKDNGVGIPNEKIPYLFDITKNESTTGTGNETGTGLGLVLCKQFTEANGGKLFVQSTKDEGSTFTVDLPLNK